MAYRTGEASLLDLMLESTFVHIQGIGETTEKSLWDQGCRTWDHLEEMAGDIFGAKRATTTLMALEESREALAAGEMQYFHERLGNAHAWRLINRCEDAIAYLDIETTGMGMPPMSHSTSVAVSFKGELFVEHETEKKRLLFEKLESEAKMWCTFNGLCFDLPFLRRELGLRFSQPHVDLRVWMRRCGYKGGLKKIQQQFPDVRQRESMDIDGFDAVRLWRMHKRGVPGALETLMTYNAEDTVVLEQLLNKCWSMECEKLPNMGLNPRPEAVLPEIVTKIDTNVYDLLRARTAWEVPSDW